MIYIFLIVAIILLDQGTKYYAEKKLHPNTDIPVIGNRLFFTLVKNKGAAYNVLENRQTLLKIITIPCILGLILYMTKLLKKPGQGILKLGVAMIIGGAVGNLVDRIWRKYVVDFLYIKHKKLPVFNMADVFIALGGLVMQGVFLFQKGE